jgi:ketosteroid isomerase-like protein
MRKMSTVILVAAVVITILLNANPAVSKQGDVRAAIEAGNKKLAEVVGRGDAAAIAELYTRDAIVFPPNSDIVKGKEAIKDLFQGLINSGIKGITLTTLEAEGFGDTANEVGRYSVKGEGGKELDNGNYIVIWKRENGQWKMHRDIFNTSTPAPGRQEKE